MDSIYKTHEDLADNTELQQHILQTFGLQSKKKRVKKKLLKQLVSQESLINKVVQEFQFDGQTPAAAEKVQVTEEKVQTTTEEKAVAETSTPSFTTLPITALLKVGKAFFKEEESVRYYYNKNKPEQYKNKELLVQCISEGYLNSTEEIQKSIEQSL
ncbi:hypothetical protein [Niallia taxi]|uniref:Uncharacterized protein n=1 Tax=Niallia taxi TaxID=2499688 RepID=A0A3S2UYX6_9BACI|nr:hypothetical protein [Niallia taxi]RVT67481.1 hypothetical protein EM808_03110 [Niallia taxi]